MVRRLLSIAFAYGVLAATPVRAARLPLDPATLGGAAVFVDAEQRVAAAAQAAGLAFAPDSRPLPPQVLLPLDTADGRIQKRRGLLYWRGDMLPDPLAPGETGTLVRRHRNAAGTWKTVRTEEGVAPAARTNLVPVARATASFALPTLILETPYQLGTLAGAPVRLVLWRTATEDSAPLGGFIEIPDEPAALRDALNARLAPFAAQADWAAEFDAFAR